MAFLNCAHRRYPSTTFRLRTLRIVERKFLTTGMHLNRPLRRHGPHGGGGGKRWVRFGLRALATIALLLLVVRIAGMASSPPDDDGPQSTAATQQRGASFAGQAAGAGNGGRHPQKGSVSVRQRFVPGVGVVDVTDGAAIAKDANGKNNKNNEGARPRQRNGLENKEGAEEHEAAAERAPLILESARSELPYCSPDVSRAFLATLNNNMLGQGGDGAEEGGGAAEAKRYAQHLVPGLAPQRQLLLPLHKTNVDAAALRKDLLALVRPVAGSAADMSADDVAVVFEGTSSKSSLRVGVGLPPRQPSLFTVGRGDKHTIIPSDAIVFGEAPTNARGALLAGWHCASVVKLRSLNSTTLSGGEEVPNLEGDAADPLPTIVAPEERALAEERGLYTLKVAAPPKLAAAASTGSSKHPPSRREPECIIAQKSFVTVDAGAHKGSELGVTPHQLLPIPHTPMAFVGSPAEADASASAVLEDDSYYNKEAAAALARRRLIALIPSVHYEGVPAVAAIIHRPPPPTLSHSQAAGGPTRTPHPPPQYLSAMSVLRGPSSEDLLFNSPSDEDDDEVLMLNDPNYDPNAMPRQGGRARNNARRGAAAAQTERGGKSDKAAASDASEAERRAAEQHLIEDERSIRVLLEQQRRAAFTSLRIADSSSSVVDGIGIGGQRKHSSAAADDPPSIPLFDGRGTFWIVPNAKQRSGSVDSLVTGVSPAKRRHFYTKRRAVRSVADVEGIAPTAEPIATVSSKGGGGGDGEGPFFEVISVSTEKAFVDALGEFGMLEAYGSDGALVPAALSANALDNDVAEEGDKHERKTKRQRGIIRVEVPIRLTRHLSAVASKGCATIAFAPSAVLSVEEGIVLRLRGAAPEISRNRRGADDAEGGEEGGKEGGGPSSASPLIIPMIPLSLTATSADVGWGGVVLRPGAHMYASYVVISFTGAKGIKKVPGTGTHVKRAPAISVSSLGADGMARVAAAVRAEEAAVGGGGFVLARRLDTAAPDDEEAAGGGDGTSSPRPFVDARPKGSAVLDDDAFDVSSDFSELLRRIGHLANRDKDKKSAEPSPSPLFLRTVLSFKHGAIVNTYGGGYGIGKGAHATIRNVAVQDAEQGLECVECSLHVDGGAFTDYPFVSGAFAFADDDNDGLYVRGGTALINAAMIGNALDDGIDSACNKNDPDTSSLTVANSHIFNCQHEGVALSGSAGATRFARVAHSLVHGCQQGVENGHSPSSHYSTLYKVITAGNQIGLRFGDDYPLEVAGGLVAERCAFVDNVAPYIDHVKSEHKEAHTLLAARGMGGGGGGVFGDGGNGASQAEAFVWANPLVAEAGLTATYSQHAMGVCNDCRVVHPLPARWGASLSSSVADVLLFLSHFASEGTVCGAKALGGRIAG